MRPDGEHIWKLGFPSMAGAAQVKIGYHEKVFFMLTSSSWREFREVF
jgi:hypothetical protein